mgnify:CR=1 FL=1
MYANTVYHETKTISEDPAHLNRLPLSPAYRTAEALRFKKRLNRISSATFSVIITDNRSTMISVKQIAKNHSYNIRIHHLFSDAPEHILKDIIEYSTQDDKAAFVRLQDYVESNDGRIRNAEIKSPKLSINVTGQHYDLQHSFDRLNQQYFNNHINARITWGRRSTTKGGRRSIRLGSYAFVDKLIRIHPGLDQHWIPQYFIEWVIYHEMLHALHDVIEKHGRKEYHSLEFREDEKKYACYDAAREFENRYLPALLRI